uniref:Uncharacterized protein n=1 Tax=Meloidogyne enterolobii TaxID=390850 RepID=A0A6V7Y2U9_MELEN|nr:unnamed protein product [Meloidogyne enterolobii]
MFRQCAGNTMHLCERIATMCERSVRCSGECSSICFGICRSSSGICLESGFVGVLTAVYDILLAVFGVLHLFMWGNVPANVRGITQQLCERIATMCERSVRCSGECSSICFGICRSSSGICLESGFVGVLTAVVWNSPGICLEFFLLCGVARSGWHFHGTCCFYGTLITAHQLYVPCL